MAKKRWLYTLLIVFACVQGNGLIVYADGNIRIHGAPATASLIILPQQAVLSHHLGAQITVETNGSLKGMEDLLAGRADIALTSCQVDALDLKLTAEQKSRLHIYPLGREKIVFIAHNGNPVQHLIKDEFVKILRGEEKYWTQFNPDIGITIVTTQAEKGSVRSVVERDLLQGKIGGRIKIVPTSLDVRRETATIPGALGIISTVLVDSSVSIITVNEELYHPLLLVTYGDESPLVKQLIEMVLQHKH